MFEKWGLIIHWDIPNDCYTASVPEMLACVGKGATRQDALEALEQEVECWLKTSQELGYSNTASETPMPEVSLTGKSSPVLSAEMKPFSNNEKAETQAGNQLKLLIPVTSGSLTLTTVRDLPIIFLAGEGDISNCSSLKQACQDVLESGQRVLVLDMTDLKYLDSSILGVMVDAVRKFRGLGGIVILVWSKENAVNRSFRTTRLESIFRTCASTDEAIEKLTLLLDMPVEE